MSGKQNSLKGPWGFSWIIPNKIAGMACPRNSENMEFIIQKGIKHLVTLSAETRPPVQSFPVGWTLIPVEEFEPPTLDHIIQFIQICKDADFKNEAVGVHCRQGLGRTGVMLACYLVHFQDLTPDRAITNIRLQRPYSIETMSQERAVAQYHDYLRSTQGL